MLAGLGVDGLLARADPRRRGPSSSASGDTQPHDVRVVTAIGDAINEQTRPGEPVAVLVRPGHQISEEIGIRDVTPYANIDSMMTEQQWDEMIRALRARTAATSCSSRQETLFDEHIRVAGRARLQAVCPNGERSRS